MSVVASYILTPAQTACLSHAEMSVCANDGLYPAEAKLTGRFFPVPNQAFRGSCVANAVVALVEYYEDARCRLSIQYLSEVLRLVTHDWAQRNLAALRRGEEPEVDFAAAFAGPLKQLTLLRKMNGGETSGFSAFLDSFAEKLNNRLSLEEGCRLRQAFEALEHYGICRYELWPYAQMAISLDPMRADARGAFPPGTHEDARKHRVVNDRPYLLRTPNNIDEIKSLLVGAQGRRPMPVVVGLDLFKGCTDETFKLPEVTVDAKGRTVSVEEPLGLHEVVLTGYRDDSTFPGGGYFTFLNSWGRTWGTEGSGRIPYRYFACFCREAGTILQEMADYRPRVDVQKSLRRVPTSRDSLVRAAKMIFLYGAVGLLSAAFVLAFESIPGVDSDASVVVERLVDYHFTIRGDCDSVRDASAVADLLESECRAFEVVFVRLLSEGRSLSGEVVVEGPIGHPPDVVGLLTNYLQQKGAPLSINGAAVKKWTVSKPQVRAEYGER